MLAINQLWSQKTSFKMCTAATLTHGAETTPLRLPHNDVHVMHATTTLNMAKSRNRLNFFGRK